MSVAESGQFRLSGRCLCRRPDNIAQRRKFCVRTILVWADTDLLGVFGGPADVCADPGEFLTKMYMSNPGNFPWSDKGMCHNPGVIWRPWMWWLVATVKLLLIGDGPDRCKNQRVREINIVLYWDWAPAAMPETSNKATESSIPSLHYIFSRSETDSLIGNDKVFQRFQKV